MADLHNLLDGLNEEDEDHFAVETTAIDNDSDGWDRDNSERPEIPLALQEAERKQHVPFTPPDSEVGDKSLGQDEEGGLVEDPDFAQLKRLWTQEMMCPELLPYDADTAELQMELLEGQEEAVEKLLEQASRLRDSTGTDPNMASLIASIYKMDADRVRFMLTDLTRTRLAKIEEHPLHMREMVDRMSEHEVSYLKQYGMLLERHFRRTVLDHMPKEAWKKLDEPEMIDKPNLDQFVFCRVMKTVEIDNYDPLGQEDADEIEGITTQEHQAGACLIVRYSAIRELVLDGKIELLL